MIKKVMIAGTFDILHPGHIFLINEAAKLGEVYVVVATDMNRKKYSGHNPIIPQDQRLEVIRNIKNVKEARIGRYDNNTLKIVEEINPDIILLGPTQHYNEEELKAAYKECWWGENDLQQAVRTAVINKRAGGTGLISGRKAFQRPMEEGIKLLHAIQDVYLCDEVTIA